MPRREARRARVAGAGVEEGREVLAEAARPAGGERAVSGRRSGGRAARNETSAAERRAAAAPSPPLWLQRGRGRRAGARAALN
jgi:hypothetical protein